ncbi:MAG: NUDIX domain-containing protein [bacterium]|nr:NUDIX domain-containing protein [bacterium]
MGNKARLFKPKAGQVDFTKVRWAPVINCVVKCGDRFLVVRRSQELGFYPGYWNGISGFLDDRKSLREKVEEELREELKMPKGNIKKVILGQIFDQEASQYKKTWVVHPVLVEVKSDKIKLNWEAKEYKWVSFEELMKMKLLPGFLELVKRFTK